MRSRGKPASSQVDLNFNHALAITACVVTDHPLVSDARAGSVSVIRAFVSERSRKEDKQQSSSLHLLDRVRQLVEYYQ